MATDKKHIAVYLDPAVEAALVAFCEQKGLKSKKGFMYSAGVNAALAQFFGIADIDNILQSSGNIPTVSTIPHPTVGNISSNVISNIPAGSIDVEVLPGKPDGLTDSETDLLRQELEDTRANYAKLLESSTIVTNRLSEEVQELRSQIEVEKTRCDELREELEDRKETCAQLERKLAVARAERDETIAEGDEISTKLAAALAGNKKSAPVEKDLPEAADLLNKLKAKRKKATASLADVETILEILEKLTPYGGN
jgi:NTP pyrophosphatase (non-canonical NTP hydrolase)